MYLDQKFRYIFIKIEYPHVQMYARTYACMYMVTITLKSRCQKQDCQQKLESFHPLSTSSPLEYLFIMTNTNK